MNNKQDQDTFRTFQLMNEIESGDAISQRELASRLDIAVGLVNSYLKNLAAKGWIRIKAYPRNRYAYLLTPKGIAEKSRLAYQHLSYFNNLYIVVRHDYLRVFQTLKDRGDQEVVFCGIDEVAEIAYLSLQEVGLCLAAVIDPDKVGQSFFAHKVVATDILHVKGTSPVVVTSLKRSDELLEALVKAGVARERILILNG